MKEMSAQFKSYLPEEYRKASKVEKRIDQARMNYIKQITAEIEYSDGNAQINQNDPEFLEKVERKATKKYIDKCRALKTFGYRFYLVKEKMKNKNKLVPVLLGINKDGIVTADAVNKEVTKMFYLTQIKQHFCTDASFHISLPGYQAEDYVVQTTEGKQIVKLLEGYIEIHLQKVSYISSSSFFEQSPDFKFVIFFLNFGGLMLDMPYQLRIRFTKSETISDSFSKLSSYHNFASPEIISGYHLSLFSMCFISANIIHLFISANIYFSKSYPSSYLQFVEKGY